LNAERGKDAGSEAGSVDLLRCSAARQLIIDARVATNGGKGTGCIRVCADLAGGDGQIRSASQVISQQNEAVRIAEWERPKEDTFDERENRGGRANTQSQDEDGGQGEARCLAQLAKCEAEILCGRVHASSLPSKPGEQLRGQD
jgi:hypothetical protein